MLRNALKVLNVFKANDWHKAHHHDINKPCIDVSVQTSEQIVDSTIDPNEEHTDTFNSNPISPLLKFVRSSTSEKHRRRMLVIDDDCVTVHVLESMFPAKDFEIYYDAKLLAMPCKEIINAILTEINPDLVILDASFLDSLPLLQGLRRMISKNDLPVLLTATSRFEQGIHKCLEHGASDFLYKPMRYQEMMYRVNNLVQLSQYEKKNTILSDILPLDIITNLENGRNFITKYHSHVTILFSDICSYTVLSSRLPTKRVIHLLNTMFCGFDDICLEHDVYKVETIGDSFMIASGHDGKPDHVERMVRVAKEMIEFVRGHPILEDVEVRVGIHTGPAHSGVIGKIRPRYCFFGDTVNTASRMESHGVPSSIHVSEVVYDQLRDKGSYIIQDRGNIEVKGKGSMHTYLLVPP